VIDLRRLADHWQRWPVVVRDLPFALFLTFLASVPALNNRGTDLGELPTRPFDALTAVTVALECLPLAVRRRWTALCLALVSLGFAIDQLRAYHTVAGIALPLALVSAGAHLERHRRTTVVLFSVAYLALIVGLTRSGSTESVVDFMTFYVVLAISWNIGGWLRRTRVAEAERRRLVAETTRTAERTRIARELHDVVTHHVTAMVVQAEAARYLTAAPERLDQTLTAVTDTGRRAISDLRHLLDLLNPDHGAPSGGPATADRALRVGDLRTLVEQTRQAGQPVEYTEDGSPPEATGSAEVAAYRVVQEALTNALKYAYGSRTTVHVHHGQKETTVEVCTDDSGTHTASPGGGGRGLAGLSERVGVLGGEFSAGPRAGGDFVVQARIPTGNPS
jgi:signal transduction histidine kinase